MRENIWFEVTLRTHSKNRNEAFTIIQYSFISFSGDWLDDLEDEDLEDYVVPNNNLVPDYVNDDVV